MQYCQEWKESGIITRYSLEKLFSIYEHIKVTKKAASLRVMYLIKVYEDIQVMKLFIIMKE